MKEPAWKSSKLTCAVYTQEFSETTHTVFKHVVLKNAVRELRQTGLGV